MGLMITYGSYLSKSENIITSGLFVAFFDTLIAIFAGLVIFPALFAMGQDPATGPALVFAVLPELFLQMPGGAVSPFSWASLRHSRRAHPVSSPTSGCFPRDFPIRIFSVT
jgi:SNF family Na+-dependent transporter